MTGREKCLKMAKEIVTGNREEQYGKPENNLYTISRLWNAYLSTIMNHSVYLKASDVASMMALFKIARTMNATEVQDSYIDACGYLACAYECECGNEDA